MGRFLVGLVILIGLIAGGLFWLANYAENHPPNPGPQTIEVDIDV